MSELKSKFTKKVSPLIEGQVPDFVQADHPVFVDFVKDYFQFLEAGKLSISGNIDYIVQETKTSAFILEETDGDRIVTEAASGSGAKFINGETITGGTTGATSTVLVEDSRNSQLFITGQQLFETGETVTGATSGAQGIVTEYRANPIQTIQQLLEYADVDNTLFDFLDQMRDSFMTAIPETLASGVSKRNLIKNIKDLYAAKGSSEGHKLFIRLLLGESSEIFYPTEYMLRLSDGDWRQRTIMRVAAGSGVSGDEVINQVITGQTSGATAVVVDSLVLQQGATSVTEFRIANITGTFVDGETIVANSTARDVDVTFTIEAIVASTALVNDGILHADNEDIDLENIGNGFGEIKVDGIAEGSVSEVIVDDVGQKYEVGDVLTFTTNSADTNVSSASGFVSMVGGGIQLETATLDDSSLTDDAIILESGTTTSLESFNIQSEQNVDDRFRGDGETVAFTLTDVNANVDTVVVNLNNVQTPSVNASGETVWTASGTTLTFQTDFTPALGDEIYVYANRNDLIILDGTNTSSDNAGHNILTDSVSEVADTYTTATDQIVLEFDTFEDILSSSTESGSIQKVQVTSGGQGYTKLPTVSITTTTGTGASLLATTENIGAARSIKITDPGFNYVGTNPPDATFRAHFVLKDVTGTFANTNTLTTHTGTVKGFDADTNVLDTTFENVVRVEQEQTSTFQEGIQLEQGNLEHMPAAVLLEDILDFDDGENIVLDGTETFTPPAQNITYKVRVARNATDTANIFYINDEPQPRLALYEGNTYYFDLSDSSLYNANSAKNHQLRFSETENGTHGGGVAYETGVTTSSANIAVGTTGAYIQIVVATGAPVLYYYCVNHSGMGNIAQTPSYETIVLNSGSNILFNATQHGPNVATIKLEDGTQGRKDTDSIVFEDTGRPILLEEAIIGTLQDVEDKLLIDRYQEDNTGNFFIDLETETAGVFGGRLATEDFGDSILLNASAADTDEGSKLLGADETGNGQITLNGTDSDSTDADSHIINESGIDFSNRNVTITDSSGASGTIVTADIATGTTAVDIISTDAGSYAGIDSLLGQDLIRIQDSYYYQDYSYEVQVGEAFSTYVNELKKAVHPAGFQPFGRVTIATLVSAAITNTAAGVSDYTGDRLFSPILASVIETLFSQRLQMRIGVPKSDRHDGQIPIGSREDQIVLDGTDGSSSNSGESILYEANTRMADDDITSGVDSGGGRLMSETSHAPSADYDGAVVKEQVVSISKNPIYLERNLLLHLAELPFGTKNGTCGIALEAGSGNLTDVLVLDGQLPLDEGDAFIVMNGTDASGSNEGDNIVLNGTDTDSSNAGENLLAESMFFSFPVGFKVDENDRFLLDSNHNDQTITLSDVGDITFEEIRRLDRINLSDTNDSINWGGGEEDGITLENAGNLLLDGTDDSSSNAGSHIIQETTLRNYVQLETSGVIVTEDFSTNSNQSRILLNDGEEIVLEDGINSPKQSHVELELSEIDGDIILDGTDSSGSNAGDFLVHEAFHDYREPARLLSEFHNVFASEGHIPLANFRLNSSSKVTVGHVQAAEIVVRSTGEIALEDATDTTNTNTEYLLDETNGNNIDLEGATGITH